VYAVHTDSQPQGKGEAKTVYSVTWFQQGLSLTVCEELRNKLYMFFLARDSI